MTARMTLACLLFAATSFAAPRPLPFDPGPWRLDGRGASIVTVDGRRALAVSTGSASHRDAELADGTIEFDVKMTERRSFVYVNFRMLDEAEREEIYFRPHKSSLPDAVQYAPVYQGRSGWQLYHGPGKTASIDVPHGTWTHVRLILRGQYGALFVGDMDRPAMVMRLARPPRAGAIGFSGFLPPDMQPQTPIAWFANVSIDTTAPTFDFERAAAPAPVAPAGVVRTWSVSKTYPPRQDESVPSLPAQSLLGSLTQITADASGMIELHKVVPIPPNTRAVAALAKVTVRADRAGTFAFDLGFSDIATVFVNGRAVFRGDGTYAYDNPRREGLIGFDQARIYLPLLEGDNDLAVEVSDVFGGWAVMGRFPSPAGLSTRAVGTPD